MKKHSKALIAAFIVAVTAIITAVAIMAKRRY